MPGQVPFFVIGKIASIYGDTAYVKMPTGYVYNVHPWTEGIDFQKLTPGMTVKCEVTNMLTRVLSAEVIDENK